MISGALSGAPQSAQKPVLTRLRKNLPPFTLRLSAAFVNGKTLVSTGFLRFFLAFLWKTPALPEFLAWHALKTANCAHLRCDLRLVFLLPCSLVPASLACNVHLPVKPPSGPHSPRPLSPR